MPVLRWMVGAVFVRTVPEPAAAAFPAFGPFWPCVWLRCLSSKANSFIRFLLLLWEAFDMSVYRTAPPLSITETGRAGTEMLLVVTSGWNGHCHAHRRRCARSLAWQG